MVEGTDRAVYHGAFNRTSLESKHLEMVCQGGRT